MIDLSPAEVSRLVAWIGERRWFRSKARAIASGALVDVVPVAHGGREGAIALVRIDFKTGDPETYVVPLAPSGDAPVVRDLGDATVDVASVVIDLVREEKELRGRHGVLRARRGVAFDRTFSAGVPTARLASAEQSNSAVIFGDRAILKLYRRAVLGENPELEILRALGDHGATPRLVGALEYVGSQGNVAVAMVQTFVASRGDAWQVTVSGLADRLRGQGAPEPARGALIARARQAPPVTLVERVGKDLDRARLLGARTAELHRALATSSDPEFAPEPFREPDRDELIGKARADLRRVVQSLVSNITRVPKDARASVDALVARAPELDVRLAALASQPMSARKIRVHGDYHLGQVLVTHDDDFVIIDFEGEPARTLDERRAKQSPLKDVAGMLRSFDYAAATALREGADPGWARAFGSWVSAAFLGGWLDGVASSELATREEDAAALLDLFLLEKAVYEVDYELNNRPAWLAIPVEGVLSLLAG